MTGNSLQGEKQVKKIKSAWDDLAVSITTTVDVLKDYQATTLKLPSEYINSLKTIRESQESLNKNIARTKKIQSEATAQQKESARVAKLLASTEVKLKNATSEQSRELQKKRIELAIINKQEKEAAQLSSKLVGEYQKQSIVLSQLRTKYKNVAISQGESSKEAQGLLLKVTELDAKLKRVDASAGQFGRVVGGYPKQLGNAAKALRSFASAFGFTSAVFILAQTVRNAVGIFKQFDQAQADLAAVLGRSKNEITDLTNQAKDLGATTAFTATQVAELQLELAKLGFNDNQILDATLGIENLAIATGVDAARAAKLGGSALRGFALDASEANKVAATLAVSTTKSASTFESLETALPKVSAIAKSFGFTIEDTTALLGGLSNAGFESSIAGTSLRQIFLQLADSNGKLAKRLGGGAKNFDELIGQFKKLEKEGVSLSEAFNLTNARSVAAFKTFLSGADSLLVLRDSITDVETELDVLAEQKLDSVQGKVTLLNSAWEGWVLSLDKSGEASETIKNALEFLTKNLDKTLNTIIKLGKAFLIYKAIVIGGSFVLKSYTSVVTLLRLAKIALAGGIGKATKAMSLFNITTKANPIGILLSVLSGGVAVWLAFRDGVKETSKSFIELKKNADLATEAIVKNTIAKIEDRLNAIDQEIDNEKKANEAKIDLLNQNIKKQEEGTANLYDDLDKITEEGNDKINKTTKQKQEENAKAIEQYYSDLKRFSQGEISEAPAFPTLQSFSETEAKQLEEQASIRTDSERKLIEKLKAMRLKLIKSLDKITKKENKKASEDLNKDIFNLEKARLKRQIKIAKEGVDDINNTLEERIVFESNFIEKSLKLLQLERDEAIRLAKGRKNKIIQINEEFENQKIDLQKKGEKEYLKIFKTNFDNEVNSLDKLKQAQKLAFQEELNDLKESELAKGEAIEDVNKKVVDLKKKQLRQELSAEIDYVKAQLRLHAFSAEQRFEVEKRLAELKGQLLDLQISEDEEAFQEELDRLAKREEAIRNAFQSIGDILGVSGDNLATIFDGIENGFEDAGEAARAFGQLTTEIINGIASAENQKLENKLTNLDKEKEIELAFAGESAAAKGEIERQYAERRAAIQEKIAKNEKKAAIASSIIGTSTAVVSALGAQPFTLANIALASTVGVLGAAQTAIIAAQEIPQFKDGVRGFEGGLAILGDGGVSEYARTPDGDVFKTPAKDTLYNLPKGTDVFKNKTDFDKELSLMLNDNNILKSSIIPTNFKIESGLSKSDFDKGINSLEKTISNSKGGQIIFDEKGYRKYQTQNNSRTQMLNNRFEFKGKNV